MNFNPEFCLLTINWFSSKSFPKDIVEFRNKLKLYSFYMDERLLEETKIISLSNNSKSLAEIIFIINEIIGFLRTHSITFKPGKLSFNDGNNCGFLLLRDTYITVLTISKNGHISSIEYPLNKVKI